MEANYLVSPQLAISLSASYIEAEWVNTEGLVATPGESLSFAPRTNANLGVQYDFDMSQYPAFMRADISYVGEYENSFQFIGYGTAGDYVNVSLRAGISIDQWSLAFYAMNLTDEDSLVSSFDMDTRLVPRRLGLEASYQF
jgi:outer membrane receptor protein involved in Fe transport